MARSVGTVKVEANLRAFPAKDNEDHLPLSGA
ncbi:hypothetical protein F443_03774 [Phytophthora nicotianae P1569]|uniref:Uncharacterized protein n=1 Tax=Phytophthora nicotianae P1569 TaxID=1317065 RepID=V9FS68_PHYNI|nr:hypothetical protein F443_03774 [Phytophthora nicotianae P1569]